MRNPDRIPQVLAEIERMWQRYPDWRLGQLICNLTIWADHDATSPYDIEDDALVAQVERHLSQRDSVVVR